MQYVFKFKTFMHLLRVITILLVFILKNLVLIYVNHIVMRFIKVLFRPIYVNTKTSAFHNST